MKRRRAQKREEKRQKKREAADLRRENDLCLCSDDERFYPDEAAADADTAPARVCETCGKPRLIVNVFSAAFAKPDAGGIPMDVAAQAIITDILR